MTIASGPVETDLFRGARSPAVPLKGQFARKGCVIKPSACEPALPQTHRPRAWYHDYPSMKKAVRPIPILNVHGGIMSWILRNDAGSAKRGPDMPEWGMLAENPGQW